MKTHVNHDTATMIELLSLIIFRCIAVIEIESWRRLPAVRGSGVSGLGQRVNPFPLPNFVFRAMGFAQNRVENLGKSREGEIAKLCTLYTEILQQLKWLSSACTNFNIEFQKFCEYPLFTPGETFASIHQAPSKPSYSKPSIFAPKLFFEISTSR